MWSTTHSGLPSGVLAKNRFSVNFAGLLQKSQPTKRAHKSRSRPAAPEQGAGRPLGHLSSSRLRPNRFAIAFAPACFYTFLITLGALHLNKDWAQLQICPYARTGASSE